MVQCLFFLPSFNWLKVFMSNSCTSKNMIMINFALTPCMCYVFFTIVEWCQLNSPHKDDTTKDSSF